MKIIITERQLQTIKASEAYDDINSIQTLVDGKRGVAVIALKDLPKSHINKIYNLIRENSLKIIYMDGNPNQSYIVYRQGFENEASQLNDIAKKYGGFLSVWASEEDSRKIGELLSYDPKDIDDYIIHNRKIREKHKST